MTTRALDRPLKDILILGATGTIGRPLTQALAAHPRAPFSLTALTRDATKVPPSTFPPTVAVKSSDYNLSSLRPYFQQADVVISCLSLHTIPYQRELIDLAVACGVARFITSDFGIDYTHPNAGTLLPLIRPKLARADEGKVSYTTVVNGALFDWFFRFPSLMGFDVPGRRATLYDGGDVEYEVSTLDQGGRTVAAALAPENVQESKDQTVFVNSFTVTQKRVLEVLEEVVGEKFEVLHESLEGLTERHAFPEEAAGGEWGVEHERAVAAQLLSACLAGEGGMDLYSTDPRVGGLWNEQLGLPKEDLREALEGVVREGRKSGVPSK